jgi:hypothetical protein
MVIGTEIRQGTQRRLATLLVKKLGLGDELLIKTGYGRVSDVLADDYSPLKALQGREKSCMCPPR